MSKSLLSVNVRKVFELYRLLRKGLESCGCDYVIDEETIPEVARFFSIVFQDSDITTIRKSLLSFKGLRIQTGREDTTQFLAWQFAGNYRKIAEGQPIVMFNNFIDKPSWEVIKFINYVPSSALRKRRLHKFLLITLTGPSAGVYFEHVMPDGLVRLMAYELGYRRKTPWPGRPSLLSGLYFAGLLTPTSELKYETILSFSTFKVNSPLKKLNSEILYYRNTRPCPTANLMILCSDCPYGRDVCPGGVRKETIYDEVSTQ